MKRIIILITASAFIQFAGCSKQQTVVQTEGIMNFMTGDVKIISGDNPVQANVGDKIVQGMIIKTGPNSIAEIRFNGSTIRINEKSSIEIKELVKNVKENKESTRFYVDNGKSNFNVTKKLMKNDEFRVGTPTAVAAVRGTEFSVDVDKDKSIIKCISGEVAVKDASSDDSAFVIIKAGEEFVTDKKSTFSAGDKKNESDIKNDSNMKNKADKNVETDIKKQKETGTGTQKIKGPSMIRAEAVKGDIEDKK